MGYTKEQARLGKKMLDYFITKGIPYEEARERTVDILDEYPTRRIFQALTDNSIQYSTENLYKKLNYEKFRDTKKL